MEENLIKIEKVAVLADISVQTLNNWYRFKRENPNNEYALLLPEYVQKGVRRTRYWRKEDIKKLKEFKKKIPHGQHGIMGKTTHRRKEKKDGKKEA